MKFIPNKFKRRRKDSSSSASSDADSQSAPRITNETVAEHREAVLSGGRQFKFPLQQSKHRVLIISAIIGVFVVVGVSGITGALLYRYKSTSKFAYRITEIIPFPIARLNNQFVTYEDYLFEVRSNLFYYRNHGQEGVDIDSPEGAELAQRVRQQSLEKVLLDALAEQLAAANNIEVTEAMIDRQIAVIRTQGGVADSDQVLGDILQDFYDWDEQDLRKSVRAQLIRQALPAVLDTDAIAKASKALEEVASGVSFAEVAEEYSEDELTRENSGIIGKISRTNTDLPPEFIDAAFSIDEGQYTDRLVLSQFGLHIIRVNEVDGDEREIAHILVRYFDVDEYLRSELETSEVTKYVEL